MKASHVAKVLRVLDSCVTSDHYGCWLHWAKPMKFGEYHDEVWRKAIDKSLQTIGKYKN